MFSSGAVADIAGCLSHQWNWCVFISTVKQMKADTYYQLPKITWAILIKICDSVSLIIVK